MPRFSTKFLLVVIAVIALWLSTLTAFPGSEDVRDIILLWILLASAVAAVYGRGRWRVFWAGFFAVLLIVQVQPGFAPSFSWARNVSRWATDIPASAHPMEVPHRQQLLSGALAQATQGTLKVLLATASGFIAAYVYEQSRQK